MLVESALPCSWIWGEILPRRSLMDIGSWFSDGRTGGNPISPVESMPFEVAPQFSVGGAQSGYVKVAPQCSVGARSGYVEEGCSNALYLSFLQLFERTMYIIFLVSFLPLVAGFGEMQCHIYYRLAHWWFGLDSYRKPKLISLFCFFTRFEADKPESLSNRCELSFSWPHTLSS